MRLESRLEQVHLCPSVSGIRALPGDAPDETATVCREASCSANDADAMTEAQPLLAPRAKGWSGVPSSLGVYWWYFPRTELDRLRVAELCEVPRLQLRLAPDGKVCLYHGMANNLAERVEWHAAQKLTLKCLESGYLSTFRFTLLALNDFDYLDGSSQIDDFFDSLSITWQAADSRHEAEALERSELQSAYHYPLNIQGNRRPELVAFVRHLKSTRSAYKRRFVKSSAWAT